MNESKLRCCYSPANYWNALILLLFICSSSFCLSFSTVSNTSLEKVVGPKKVAVAGATGRTGRLVVQRLLERESVQVIALVRDLIKAKETLPSDNSNVSIVECDLSNSEDIKSAVSDCDAAIWCATGFSDQPGASLFRRLQTLFRLSFGQKKSIDLIAIPALAEIFQIKEAQSRTTRGARGAVLPKIVMMSSAGVTRPKWSADKKKMFPDCADIPIVRLNPFGILDIKAESEEILRQSGVDYCIFRPCGLNNDWPSGSRPIFSQGDIAVGRIHRADAAKILVDALYCTEAVAKTFEAFTVKGYAPPRSISNALKRLKLDSELAVNGDACLSEAYSLLQQLLPGEVQEPSQLAMGQTYEQLDNNEVGRFGKRGEEDVKAAFVTPAREQ